MNKEQLINPENQNTDNQASGESTAWDSLQEIEFNPDEAAQIQITDTDKLGAGRQDKDITIKGSDGQTKHTSSIMIGKNEAGYNLDDNTYISAADVEQTISDALTNAGEDAQLVDTKYEPPRPVTPAEAVSGISANVNQKHSSITISQNEKITNQDARNAEVNLPGVEEKDLKGVLMLGNENIEFANGEYLSEAATMKALEDYMIANSETLVAAGERPTETVIYVSPEAQGAAKTAISERAKKIKRIIAGTAATLIMIASLIGVGGDQANGSNFDPNADSRATESQIIDDAVSGSESLDQQSINQEVQKFVEATNQLEGVDIGDTYLIPDGVKVHESSDYEYDGANDIGTIGSELLPDRDYTIQSFSVLDPDTHEVVADNVTWEEGTNLGEYLEKVSQDTGAPIDKLKEGVKIHVGHGDSSAGWVDYNDIIHHTVEEYRQSENSDSGQRIIEEAPLQGEVKSTKSDQIGEPTSEPTFTEENYQSIIDNMSGDSSERATQGAADRNEISSSNLQKGGNNE